MPDLRSGHGLPEHARELEEQTGAPQISTEKVESGLLQHGHYTRYYPSPPSFKGQSEVGMRPTLDSAHPQTPTTHQSPRAFCGGRGLYRADPATLGLQAQGSPTAQTRFGRGVWGFTLGPAKPEP